MKRITFVTKELQTRGMNDQEIEEFMLRFGNSLRLCKNSKQTMSLLNAALSDQAPTAEVVCLT